MMTESLESRPLHPTIAAALRYWESKRGNRSMPSRRDIDPCDIPKLLPQILLFDISHDPLDFRYRLVGTQIDYHMGEPRTGQWMRSIPHQAPGSIIWSAVESVVTNRRPLTSNVPYVGPHNGYKTAEDIILPLSDDDRVVNMLLVTVAYTKKDDTSL